MRETSRAQSGGRLWALTGTASVLLMLAAACASTPPAPDASLNAAKMAISNAERADASHYAGAELGEARQKLALADGAVLKPDMILAERLAQEARVEAELAFARTEAAKATAVNDEMARGADALMEELDRAGGQR
jgi:Domain of unknown function (DUF4398)